MNPVQISTVEYRPQNEEELESKSGEKKPKTSDKNLEFNLKNSNGATKNPMPPAPTPLPAKIMQHSMSKTGAYKSKRVFKVGVFNICFNYSQPFQVIIIGDAGVGKTCLSYRFCNGRFPGSTEATIGVDFRERSLIIDDELIRVQLVGFPDLFINW